ncbi:MAG: metallophosphoesterase [Candidatus Fimenecus sp.]
MSKRKKTVVIILSVVLAILLTVGIVLGILWFPVKGEKNNEVWLSSDTYKLENTVVLQKEPGKDFKILNLTDIQYNDVLDFAQRGYTRKTITALIEQEKPDLITLTGDQVWMAFQKQSQKELVKFIDSFGIPWAPVFGNHDGEGNADKQWLADRFLEAEHCLFKKGPNNIGGVGNYIINIMEGDKIVQSLIMMDSGASRDYSEITEEQKMYSKAINPDTQEYILNDDGSNKIDVFGTGYEFISESQIAWYKWAIKGATEVNGGETPESIAFFHIALPEFHLAYLQWKDSGYDSTMGFGEKREQVCCPSVNSGMFAAIKEMGSTKNVVVGHDHVNNYSVLYDGVRLTYAMKTGNRCYADDDMNGGTVLTVTDSGVTTEHKYIKI